MKRWFGCVVVLGLTIWLSACGASPPEEPAAGGAPHAGHGGDAGDGHGARPEAGHGDEAGDVHGDSPESGHGAHPEAGHGDASTPAAKASFAFPDGPPAAGVETTLSIDVTDESGAPIERFAENHEKLMHLIVVSEDLSRFEHLHPEYSENGSFAVEHVFPAAGRYKLFADFVPEGGGQTTVGAWIEASGEPSPPADIAPDAELDKTTDGTNVALALDGAVPNGDATLTFTFRDAASNRPIDDLEPYLGAVGHVVILSEDAETYLHVHPSENGQTGPEATFRTSFPSPGLYKIWGQFQREGKLLTVPFVVEIE